MDIPRQLKRVAESFAEGLRSVLGDRLCAAWLHGAAVLPGDVPTGDIDFHVLLASPLGEGERRMLEQLHDRLCSDYPPLGCGMDGYYVLLDDARGSSPPRSQMWRRATDHSWALHRAHLLAGRGITLHGPEPSEIIVPPAWSELEEALESEMAYVLDHLSEYPDYCVLQLCRIVMSHESRDVVISKSEAAEWAVSALPEFSSLVLTARRAYPGRAMPKQRDMMLEGLPLLVRVARGRIARAGSGAGR
ncbi:DUF4111 domain-containing protein [Candidatus Fermentibacterales bacterium]|nr:DUF4111 domain-containing protein [Candidatus Fermentibacterales bacterium]